MLLLNRIKEAHDRGRSNEESVSEGIKVTAGQITGAAGVIKTEERDFSGFDTISVELEAFADAATGGTAYPVTPEQAIHGCAVIEAIVKSAETGAAVKVS